MPREARHRKLRIRGLEIGLTQWGPEPSESDPPLILLHGFLDSSDTFQFLVDAFARERAVIAPDWRGFGRSDWAFDGYWFPDYLADLDALLDELSPERPARLVGHSMGGNVLTLYAGVRPERIHSLISIEGFGLPHANPDGAPERYRKWLQELRATWTPRIYPSHERLARAIRVRHPRVSADRSLFIARAWSKTEPDGTVTLLGDPRHKRVNPVLYRREEAEHCWRRINAPCLLILGELSEIIDRLEFDVTGQGFKALIPHVEFAKVADAGHMMHWEQPERVAAIIESFLDRH